MSAPMEGALKKQHTRTPTSPWLEQLCVLLKCEKRHMSALHPAKYVCQIVSCWGVANSDAGLEALSNSSGARPTVRSLPKGNCLNSIQCSLTFLQSSDGRNFHAHRILVEASMPTLQQEATALCAARGLRTIKLMTTPAPYVNIFLRCIILIIGFSKAS